MANCKRLIVGLVVLFAGSVLSGCRGSQFYKSGEYAVLKDKNGIHYAAWRGDLDRVKSLLAANPELVNAQPRADRVKLLITKGANVNPKDYNGSTPLHWAVFGGQPDMLEFLISKGANVNAVYMGRTVLDSLVYNYAKRESSRRILRKHGAVKSTDLSKAVKEGNVNKVKEILSKCPGLVNAKDNRGRTALHLGAERGHKEVVDALIPYRANWNAVDDRGNTPLHYAVRQGNEQFVEALLSLAEVDVENNQGLTALHVAVISPHGFSQRVAELLLENGADLYLRDSKGSTAMQKALFMHNRPGDLGWAGNDVVDFLCKHGAFKNEIHRAVHQGKLSKVKSLLSERPELVNSKTLFWRETPLHIAAKLGRSRIAKILISHGANVNAKTTERAPYRAHAGMILTRPGSLVFAYGGDTPLHKAVEKGYIEVTEVLLANGANVNAANALGCTALHKAAKKGYKGLSQLLIEKGANVNAESSVSAVHSRDRGTPLHLAVRKGHKDVVELLVSHGSNVKARDYMGYTVLHLAASRGDKELAEFLIKKGANVNAQTDEGAWKWTPLHIAAWCGNKEFVEFLLAHGADVNVEDSKGEVPLDVAEFTVHPEIVRLLRTQADEF